MILSIDLGGTQIKSGLITENFEIEELFSPAGSPDNLEDCLKLFDTIILPHLDKVDGIAISAPGTIDTNQGIIYHGGLLTFLHEFKVKEELEERYHKPVMALNDGKAAALAELASGALKGSQNALALVLGSGLGGGIIINGQLYQGSHFQAGELTFAYAPKVETHTPEDLAGINCSAVSFIERVTEVLNIENRKDGKAAFEAINDKNPQVYPLFELYCRHVATQIFNLQTAFDVEKVVIGGGISSQPILVEEINRQFDILHGEIDFVKQTITRPEIVTCHHRNGANLVGAAYFLKQAN